MRLSFGPFAFDRQSRLLWRNGAEVALPPRVLGVLELLIDRAGQVVARQDLLNGVWKDAFVTDTSLAEAVSFLRQALGDDPQAPRYIQTVHRRGYRFIADLGSDASPTPGARAWGLSPGRDAAIAWQLLPWSAAVLCVTVAAAALWGMSVARPAPELPAIARFDVRTVDGTAFDRRAPAIAVSADGKTLVWAACAEDDGRCGLYVRRVDRQDAARLPGSDGAAAPFFSPDGRWVGFFANGKLQKVATAGGAPAILADASFPGGGAWSADGRIVFSGSAAGGLTLVPDQGGAITPLTRPKIERGELRHTHPAWLPSGGLLFTVAASPLVDAPGELAAMRPDGKDWKILRAGVTRSAPAGTGYLLLAAGGDLQAATFDERTLTLTGGADSVLASVTGGEAIGHFAIGGGTMVAATAPKPLSPAWSDGTPASTLTPLSSIVMAPDGRRAAGVMAYGSASDIWVDDPASGTLTRLTQEGSNVSPVWSADGGRIFFATRTSGPFGLASRTVGGREPARPIPSGDVHAFPSSVSLDGRIAVTTVTRDGHTAAAIVPASGGVPQVLEAGPFNEGAPAFSPDGRWLAMESDESGRTEIVARAVADGRRVAISTDGGSRPRWSADGRFVYYESGPRVLRAAFDADRGAAGARETLLRRPGARILAVTPAGRVLAEGPHATPDRALVVLQWLRELRERLPLPVNAPR